MCLLRALFLCRAIFALRREGDFPLKKENADFTVADHASGARENVAISFGSGGYGALVSATGFLAGLKELTCSADGKVCPLTHDSFSMISGASGGGWGIGLYFSGATKPDAATIGSAGYDKLDKLFKSSNNDMLKAWSLFVKNELLQPAGFNDSMKMLDQKKKELVYVAAAFDARDAERPDIVTYSSKGFCFLHKRVCHAWDNNGLSVIDAMLRTSYATGCIVDMVRLPPYVWWKRWLRTRSAKRPVRPLWLTNWMRDKLGSQVALGVVGPYEKTSDKRATYPGVFVSDGGLLDNGAVLPALAAGKNRLIAITLLGHPRAQDLVPGAAAGIYLNDEMIQLFGVEDEYNMKANYIPLDQVFPRDAVRPVLKALEKSVKAGRGGVVTFRLHTIQNDYFHIEKGRLVTMTIVAVHSSDSCSDRKRCIVAEFEEGNPCEFDEAATNKFVNEMDNKDDEPHDESLSLKAYKSIEDPSNSSRSTILRSFYTMKSKLFNLGPRHSSNSVSLMDTDEFVEGDMGGKASVSDDKLKLPRLPLLMPSMEDEKKNLSIKCALAAHNLMAEVVKRNALHFTESPFDHMTDAKKEGYDNTFADLKDSKCEKMPTKRCFIWCNQIKGATCSSFTCKCPEYSCFRDGKCQGM